MCAIGFYSVVFLAISYILLQSEKHIFRLILYYLFYELMYFSWTKITSTRNKDALSYHIMRELYFLVIIFARTIITF